MILAGWRARDCPPVKQMRYPRNYLLCRLQQNSVLWSYRHTLIQVGRARTSYLGTLAILIIIQPLADSCLTGNVQERICALIKVP
jgi:hypothetical protein